MRSEHQIGGNGPLGLIQVPCLAVAAHAIVLLERYYFQEAPIHRSTLLPRLTFVADLSRSSPPSLFETTCPTDLALPLQKPFWYHSQYKQHVSGSLYCQ